MTSQQNQQDTLVAGQQYPLVPRRDIDVREWWLWILAVIVTLVLMAGIVALTFPGLNLGASTDWFDLKQAVRGLAGLVLIFDIYTLYQHFQLQRIRRALAERDQLFQLITENAADLIAVVDTEGRRLYNSPAYRRVLGYTDEELKTSALDQIHPDDKQRVMEAGQKAHGTGRGERLEYRIRHKDGSWRVLESTASAVKNGKGETTKLVIVNRDITQRKQAEDLLAHNAFHDKLTTLPNRALFVDRLDHALTLAKRHSDYKFAVFIIDVDEFKVFNDSLGHANGDQLLIEISKRLTASLRNIDTISRSNLTKRFEVPKPDDTLARLGGDEFTVLLDDIRNPSDAIRVAQRIQEKWDAPFIINGQEVVVTISVGIALSDVAYSSADDLLRDAEIAMYRAKQSGKGSFEIFDPNKHASAFQRLKLETDIRKGLEQGEFKVFYQPIVSLKNGRIIGFEALSRWQRPTGIVPPNDFITVADESGLIIPMNRQLMQDAARQLKSWQEQFPSDPPLYMSVNITSKQFALPNLCAEIAQIVEKAELKPQDFQLEITETITMTDPIHALTLLTQLRELGFRISIDDFGTGYSSLGRLQGFPADALKIDRTFISKMDADQDSEQIVKLIVTLGHALRMKVVGEGTETEDHVNRLKNMGCEMAQGYFFSKPVDDQAINQLLAKFTWSRKSQAAAQ
ncbi:MAG TPA: EAL domain-containing protein [Terriglobales bacterium]